MNATRATAAGVIGTGAITALWQVEPAIGLPRIAVGHILSTFMAVSVAHLNVGIAGGWIVHLLVGIILALIYASMFAERLPGSAIGRGAIYGVIVFVVSQLVFMPLVGGGFFSRGDLELLAGSLLGNVAYGIVVAWIYDLPTRVRVVATPTGPSTHTT
jgi:hypothetical protein